MTTYLPLAAAALAAALVTVTVVSVAAVVVVAVVVAVVAAVVAAVTVVHHRGEFAFKLVQVRGPGSCLRPRFASKLPLPTLIRGPVGP